MSDHFKFEMLRLSWDRYARSLVQDHFLKQFDSAWRGLPHDTTGIGGSEPPKWWTDAYLKLQKKEYENKALGSFMLEKSGVACNFTTSGNLTLQSASGATQIDKDDLLNLIAGIMKGAPSEQPAQTSTPGGNVDGITSQASRDDRPIMKQRMLQNLKEMERMALESSKHYPRSS